MAARAQPRLAHGGTEAVQSVVTPGEEPLADAPDAAASAVPSRLAVGQRVRAYLALTKPRIIELLLVTTLPSMVLAADGLPKWWIVLATMVGGTLAAGSANALNCYVDRDIDAVMRRRCSDAAGTRLPRGTSVALAEVGRTSR